MKSWLKLVWAIPLVVGFKVYGQIPDQIPDQPDEGPWKLSARLGAQFSDNRDGLAENKESNWDIYLEPRADYRFQNGERTLLDLAVVPMVKWHSNPRDVASGSPQNETELFGTAMVELMHQLSPRVTLTLGDAITYNDDPQIDNGGANVRYSNNHIWNNAHAGIEGGMTETVAAGVKGSYIIKRYDDSVVAENEDEDILDGQAYLKYKTGANCDVLGIVGVSDFKNKSVDHARGSTVMSAGAGVEKTFNPDFKGKVLAGYQHGEYDNEDMDSIDTPNGSLELTFRAQSATRFRVNASYGLYAPYVRPYAIQTLTAFTGAIDHDVLANRLMVSLLGQYGHGKYKSEGVDYPGGSDDMVSVGISANYRINRTWSVQGGYTYENWDSDVRESFSRNLVDFGVKAEM